MLAIRTYIFTIFIVPNDGLQPTLRKGDRVLVNRLARTNFAKGEVVLFGKQQQLLGIIAATPGDTIMVNGLSYKIPNYCHGNCTCGVCQYVLIGSGKQQALVQQGDIRGKAYSLWRWKKKAQH